MIVRGQVDQSRVARSPELPSHECAVEVAVAASAGNVVDAVFGSNDLSDEEPESIVDAHVSAQQCRAVFVSVSWEEMLVEHLPVVVTEP
jgi:surface antigen